MNLKRPLITLLTDFGTEDTYVGQMKGVIAARCPAATVIDLTHAVRPQAIEQGAFLLETAVREFPSGSIHVAVVDPGVGTARLGLAIRCRRGDRDLFFVGPDNGLLSCALPDGRRPATAGAVPVSEGAEVVSLGLPKFRLVSSTFHGRDVFAIAAARLATGDRLDQLGSPVHEMIALPPFEARASSPGVLQARVVHIDRFGNVIITARASQFTAPPRAVRIGATRITSFVRTYGDGDGLVALVGSSGYLEVAEVNGNAAARLGVSIGEMVHVEVGG
ncbi:MAG: SAM hydrolase/SAM-dependent halogenase family protein [Dehalococcoidia bacterium]